MTLELPNAVAAYFIADKGDADAVAGCFTDHAIVRDEGKAYEGLDEIRQWKADVSKKYQYTSEPFACQQRQGKTVVTSRLVGNFPGSPVDLRFFFELEGEKITSLEIIP